MSGFLSMSKAELGEMLDGGGRWGLLFVTGIVSLIGISILSFAISTVEEYKEGNEALFSAVENFSVLIFTVEYILRCWVADNVCLYVIQPIPILDLLSILPTWIDLFVPGDALPAYAFLRMLRIFKFASNSERGGAASAAFSNSWKENKSLIVAASFAGLAVWLVTASLQYFAERLNPEMDWCYPPAKGAVDCACDDDGCSGEGCECVKRFGSIPSAMFFVLLNLSGEFPLADKSSNLGRVVGVATAIISVGIFAIPTGLIGAALEKSVGALDANEEDYDVDDGDVEEIAAEARSLIKGKPDVDIPVPPFTLQKRYKHLCGVLICLSTLAALMSTMKSMPYAGILVFFVLDIMCGFFFLHEHIMRVITAGPSVIWGTMFSSLLPVADLMAWLPSMLRLLGGAIVCPYYLVLSVALFRMIKWERYSRGFQILAKVLAKSQGVLVIGGMAAAVCLVLCSTLMYFCERNNPDPSMRKYYSSVPTAMWMTLLNLSGEAPLCDYTLPGRIIVGFLSIVAVAIFGIPVGALGSGFEDVISELASGEDEEEGEGGESEPLVGGGKQSYHTLSTIPTIAEKQAESAELENVVEGNEPGALQRIVAGRGPQGRYFMAVSVLATLFAVTLEVVSTCAFASASPIAVATVHTLEAVVVVWFTFEYSIRAAAMGSEYVFSWLGVVDFLATFPWFVAVGLFGSSAAVIVNMYDGPLRGLRLLRLVRLDTYAPSLSLVDDALRACWGGLSVAGYASAVLWFLFTIVLFLFERDDVENGEDQRFRSALSSAQYSAVLITGDYPIKDFTLGGKLCCVCAVVVAVGIVAVPASVLAGAFVEILQDGAAEERRRRKAAAASLERIFLSRKDKIKEKQFAMHGVVKNAITHSAVLRGLGDANPPTLAKLCVWKNGRSDSAELYRQTAVALVFLNVLAVVLESVPFIEESLPHLVWQGFEFLSVLFFTAEYALNVLTAVYDPRHNFLRSNFVLSFVGVADLLSIVPFYLQTIVLPLLAPQLEFDATIFRMLRLARIVQFEQFFDSFTLLEDVFVKAAPVLKATGVVALIVWVGGASIFYYMEPHSEDEDVAALAQGGADVAVFTSIVDALYYCAIFLAGEWAVVDFTPAGSVLCTAMALIGVALFSIPVGVLFEGFQDKLVEKHGSTLD